MRAHEAGALHAEAGHRGPAWLAAPTDPNRSIPRAVVESGDQGIDGVLTVAGVAAAELAAEFGTPLYVVDEADFRARARAFRDAFAGADVYYAGKAFLTVASVRWIDEEGLNLDVCSGGELAVALAAGFDPARIGFHGNNKSVAELERAVEVGVGRIIVDSDIEIERLGCDRRAPRRRAAGPAAGHGRRRGPHARVHRHRARGPEVRLLDRRGRGRARDAS